MLTDLGRLDLVCGWESSASCAGGAGTRLVAAARIRYRRSLAPFERLMLRSRIVCWDERSFWMEQRFERGGATVAHAWVRSAILGPQGRVSPPEMVEVLAPGVESPPRPEAIREWQRAEAADAVAVG